MRKIVDLLITLSFIIYPFVFFIGLSYFELRTMLLVLIVPLLLRFITLKKFTFKSKSILLFGLMFLGIVFLKNNPRYFMLTPVLINLGLLAVFGSSLFTSQCLIEKFARLQTNDLTAEELLYCRQINIIWCMFFLMNIGIAGYLTWINNLVFWTVYNGFIGYILLGALVVIELFYRHWRFRHYTGVWTDPFFMKIFPPK